MSVGVLGRVLELLDDLLARLGITYVLGLEAVLDVDAELALGQVADVPHRRDDLVVPPRYLLIVFAFAGDSTMTSAFAMTVLLISPARLTNRMKRPPVAA